MVLALEGIKVVETVSAMAAPMAGRLLADLGADVIHVEYAKRAGMTGPSLAGSIGGLGSRVHASDLNYIAENHNRNKRGMAMDLSCASGREIIYRLLKKADVFLSNFRPYELKKFELEYDTLSQLNPRLVFANLTGYNRKGPDRDAPGYEGSGYFARSGMLHLWQKPAAEPDFHPIGSGDYMTGMSLAYGMMTALFVRERTGTGQEVDVSLFNTGVFALSANISGALATGQDLQQARREDVLNALNSYYQTKDGRWLRFVINQPDLYWSRLCRCIEREDLEHDLRFASMESRVENHLALFHVLEEAFLTKTLDEWKPRLDEAGIPYAPVRNLTEAIKDPQARANDFFVPFDHPIYGRMELVANPVKLSKTPETVRLPAPKFGQHTDEILLEYGYIPEDIQRFREQGVVV